MAPFEGVPPDPGLTHAEAARRLAEDGPNALATARRPTLLEHLWHQLSSFIGLLLLGAAVIAYLVGEHHDGHAILVALLLNVGVGAWMDARAEGEVARLGALVAPRARVWREGAVHDIPATEVVRGDLMVLEAGDRIPADGRLVTGRLTVDESLLTGESLSVDKDPGTDAMVHAATSAASGTGEAVVTATGPRTELGRIGRLLDETEAPPSLLDRRLEILGRTLVAMVAAVAALIVALGLWQGRPWGPLLETAVVLAIAAIPEGLPTVATLALAAGSRRLAKRGLRLKAIASLETLGALTALALDKTGTLTANAMTVRRVATPAGDGTLTGRGWDPAGALETPDAAAREGALRLLGAAQACNQAVWERHETAWHIHGDPTDGALLVAAARAGLPPYDGARRLLEPVGPGHPWMEVAVEGPWRCIAKGAPEQLLTRAVVEARPEGDRPMTPEVRERWLARNRALAEAGMRVLGVVAWSAQGEATWLGLIGLADPPREGAKEAIARAHDAGIRTLMITGDQPATARAIARELDLAGGEEPRVVTGSEEMDPAVSVYARATPEGKHALVLSLQRAGEVVAMTGDGVNDAPALRAADVGVAMGRGSDVARQAATAVLVDERLETLLLGVAEGRAAFVNIQRAVDYLLTCSFATLLAVLLTTASGAETPLTPLQILYLNLLTHTFPALGLALEPPDEDVLGQPPIGREAQLLGSGRRVALMWHAILFAVTTLAMASWGFAHGGLAHARTLAFSTLAGALWLHTLTDRARGPFAGWGLRRNPPLMMFLAIDLALQIAALTWPPLSRLLGMSALAWHDAVGVGLAVAIATVAAEVSKTPWPGRPSAR